MPMFSDRDDSEEEGQDFDVVSGMADRLGLKGQQRANYIHDHMEQLGYDNVQTRESYVRRQQEEQETPGNRWGFGGGRGQGQSRNRRDDGDSF